jgi:hypothetical protein
MCAPPRTRRGKAKRRQHDTLEQAAAIRGRSPMTSTTGGIGEVIDGRRPWPVTATAAMAGFVGVTAVGGGVEMLRFPHGNQFVPGAWLDGIPVIGSWVVPGLVLGGVFGGGGLATAYGLLRRPRWRACDSLERWSGRHWSWLASVGLGTGLAAWVAVEVALIPQRSPIEAFYTALAAGLVVLPLQRRSREHLRVPAGQRGTALTTGSRVATPR